MSIQELYGNFPMGPELPQLVDNRRMQHGDPRVITFAKLMIEAGRTGLVDITTRIGEGDVVGMDPRMSEKILNEGSEDYAAILLGSAIVSIHETIVDGIFDPKNFMSRVTDGLRGTQVIVSPLSGSQEEVEKIDSEKLKDMRALAQKDPTLCSLVAESKLPDKLIELLESFAGEHSLLETFLEYQKRAQLLVKR